MTRRAAITQADIARAARVARKHGMEVEVWPATGKIRLISSDGAKTPAESGQQVDEDMEIRL